MWEIGSSSRSTTTSSLGDEINVLLVEADKGWLSSTTHLLQMYSYKVTNVETAVAALSLLSNGKKKFDIMLVDINIRDMDAFTLLKLSAKMDLLTMLMSENDDDATISKALKSGAFLLVRRPITIDVVKQMRQHVIRERMRRVNMYDDERNEFDVEMNGASETRKELKRKVGITINDEGKKRKAKNGVPKKSKRGRKSNKNQECSSVSSVKDKVRNGSVKRRTSTEWTEELHVKFMDAVNQLGEGRCYPKEILETMNVPGLTRMQVASHLQKCRNDNWQSPVMRKYRHPSSVEVSKEGSQRRDNHRRFGSMPHVDQIEPNVKENIYTTNITSSHGIVFTENGVQQNQQNQKGRNRFGSYPLMMKGRDPTTFYNGAQTMGNTNCELDANFIANETIYVPTIEQTSENENHTYDPINLDLGAVIPGGENHSIIIEQTKENQTYDPINMDQQQSNDDFFEFLHGNMDDYVPDLNAMLQEGSIVDQGSTSQPFLYGYRLPEKATVNNQDIGGQWSASPSNFLVTDEQ